MQIPLKRIESHTLAFDGGRIKVMFGEPLLLEKSTLRLCEIWSIPPSLERTRFERIYTMSIIFDFANDPNFLGLLTGSLRDVKYWWILFSNKKGFHQTMKAQIRGANMDTGAKTITVEFTLPEKPIQIPKSITLPISTVREMRTVEG